MKCFRPAYALSKRRPVTQHATNILCQNLEFIAKFCIQAHIHTTVVSTYSSQNQLKMYKASHEKELSAELIILLFNDNNKILTNFHLFFFFK